MIIAYLYVQSPESVTRFKSNEKEEEKEGKEMVFELCLCAKPYFTDLATMEANN